MRSPMFHVIEAMRADSRSIAKHDNMTPKIT